MQKLRNQKGITLTALIITIIVMLILVGVSVVIVIKGELFTTAKKATTNTGTETNKELALSNGSIEIDGKKYASYQDYLDRIVLTERWTRANTKPEGWSANVIAITDGTNTIPLPKGFEISEEDEVDNGLVVKDGDNEFVWIPVENAETYIEDSFGPLEGKDGISKYVYDSQDELDYYYGEEYYNYEEDFNYEEDRKNVENSIKTYGGFYVGRYETTINNGIIGVQKGKTVLTSNAILKEEGDNKYYYRWWGLYKGQKDMYANSQSVGSLMISSKQWDAILAFIEYDDETVPGENNVNNNIYNLERNCNELSSTPFGDVGQRRTTRGGLNKTRKCSY